MPFVFTDSQVYFKYLCTDVNEKSLQPRHVYEASDLDIT